MMRLIPVILLCTSLSAGEFQKIPKEMLKATHRLMSADSKKFTESANLGTAVAVDLSDFELNGKKYMLTAAHCVVNKGKKQKVFIEMTEPKRKWVEASILEIDEDMDICLLAVDQESTVFAKLAKTMETEIGDPVVAIGSPRGMALAATIGYMSDISDSPDGIELFVHPGWYQASMAVFHGNSGGPVFDLNRNVLVGIVAAIILDDGMQAAPNVTLMVGHKVIVDFVSSYAKKVFKKAAEKE